MRKPFLMSYNHAMRSIMSCYIMSCTNALKLIVIFYFLVRLRTHFKKSQFIVVSLKEGMFNNANVLFRTKFVDGVSTVARTTPGQR